MSVYKWTYDNLKNEALKYNTRNEFKINSGGAYAMARKRKCLDDICSHMEFKLKKWNEHLLVNELGKYKTLKEFRMFSASAYNYALRENKMEIVLKKLQHNKKKNISNKELILLAKGYGRIIDFKKNHINEYQTIKRRGIENIAFKHMRKQYYTYDFRILKSIANRYKTRSEFYRKNQRSYAYARNMGILDIVCKDFLIPEKGTDNDCIYVWNIDGTDIYKVGITSYRLGIERIKKVASRFHKYNIIIYKKTKICASELEKQILNVGKIAKMDFFHGYTEFRHFTNEDILYIINSILKPEFIDAEVE